MSFRPQDLAINGGEAVGVRHFTIEVHPTTEQADCDDILAAIGKVSEAYAL